MYRFKLSAGSTTPRQQRAELTHPSHEVDGSPSVEQQRGHVDVAVVSCDVQGRESALAAGESRRGGEEEMKTCKDSRFSAELRLSRSPHCPSVREGVGQGGREGTHAV